MNPTQAKGPLHYILHTGMKIEFCWTCEAPIVWGKTDAGKAVPLSLQKLQEHPEKPGTWGALSHFTDCPDAKEHSGRRR